MPSISAEIARAVGRRSVPLKNMCSAKWAIPRDVGGLVARARVEHDEAGDRLGLRHRCGEDTHAVGEGGSLEDGHRRIVDMRRGMMRHAPNHRRHRPDRAPRAGRRGLRRGDRAARGVGRATLRPVDARRIRRRGLVAGARSRRLALRAAARVRRRDRVPGVQLGGRQRPERGGRPRRDRPRQLRLRPAGGCDDPDVDRRLRAGRRRRRMADDARGQGELRRLAPARRSLHGDAVVQARLDVGGGVLRRLGPAPQRRARGAEQPARLERRQRPAGADRGARFSSARSSSSATRRSSARRARPSTRSAPARSRSSSASRSSSSSRSSSRSPAASR